MSSGVVESAIDFARSSCTWLLRDQDSRGCFAIDAVLTVGAAERYVLTAQVFAGNVYAGEGLFKDPPYGFSAAFSATHFRIFRDPVRGEAGGGDTRGVHSDMFREIQVDLHQLPCQAIRPEALFAGNAALPLCARIELPQVRGQAPHTIEFPVRHINVDSGARRFQVETGPVLALEEGEGDVLECLRRAYVNFGQLDRAEFLLDSPRVPEPARRWSGSAARGCKVTLLCAIS